MTLNWFLSRTVRQATAMRKHVLKILNHQRDILATKAISEIEAAMQEVSSAVAANAGTPALEAQMENLEKTANKWLKPYPNAAWRENIEVLLVALTIAMGIRTFFLQPFKIPTGSMQPTLYGVVSENLMHRPDFKIPGALTRAKHWFEGISYVRLDSKVDGKLERVENPVRFAIFNLWQKVWIGERAHWIILPPDYGQQPMESRAGLMHGATYRRGEPVVRLQVESGDHLFVDRVSYNFRTPRRGEIIVFETKGIPQEMLRRFQIPSDQFYIKRLVALGGERVQIGNDRHVRINGVRLDASTPRFENIYGFSPSEPPRDSHYSGHVKEPPGLAPYFHGRPEGVLVAPGHLMVMGDNTLNSLDSRGWGDFPATNVIGKSFFIYWPITDRFGWGYR
jgi:signal peptidase I